MITTAFATSPEVNEALCMWCANQIWPMEGEVFSSGALSMGVFDDEKLIAVVVFHDWNPKAGLIEISAASVDKRWLTRPVLKSIFNYAFNVAKCQMVVMRATASAQGSHMNRIFTAYGFDHVLIPRLYGRNENGFVYYLTDDAWRANGFHKEMTHG
jgi:RimJ/RimL family protein N-acetyltransferase